MLKPVYRTIGRCVGISLSAALLTASAVSLRHILETPQPLKSSLPGESRLYVWQRHSIFYKALGDPEAPPLLLLHTPKIGTSAQEMLHIMQPLAQSYRVYAPDLLGFGLSDRPGIEYSTDIYTTLCQDFLRDVVQKPALLVASGLSCNYAVSVAAHTPESCLALVLISPLALYGDPHQPFWLKAVAGQPLLKIFLYTLLSTRLAFWLTHSHTTDRGNWPQFYATTHQLGAEHAAMDLLAGKLRKNTAEQFETLPQPLLMIWGAQALEEQQNLAGLNNTTSASGLARQNREVELIQEAGLAVQEEQPARVVAAITRWQAVNNNALLQTQTEDTPQIDVSEPIQTTQTLAEAAPDQSSLTEIEPFAPEVTAVNSDARPVQKLLAYCIKCKAKREMLNAHEFVMKNGRKAVRGTCVICGTNIHRIGGIN
jgi:pimeloyl-ACP methyl ester carboxylesterase